MTNKKATEEVKPSHYVAVHSIQHNKTLYKAGDKIPAENLSVIDRDNLLKAKSVYPYLGDSKPAASSEEE
jgi:hypothetical protein